MKRFGAIWIVLGAAVNIAAAVEKEAEEDSSVVLAGESSLVIDLGGGVTMEFALIKPGSFIMGSAETDLLDQKPPHEVTISEPFYLSIYEVTQDQWAVVMDGTNPSLNKSPYVPDSGSNPVDNVSWVHCQMFVERLNERIAGFEFRLPTEAEWEYACRAGTTGARHLDDDAELGDYARFSGNSDNRSRAVGGKTPNSWGLYDMYGNVWEWCADLYDAYPGGTLPQGVSTGGYVIRGGGYDNLAEYLTSAYRQRVFPQGADGNIGFRVAVRKQDSR